jgi:hypothetical protein
VRSLECLRARPQVSSSSSGWRSASSDQARKVPNGSGGGAVVDRVRSRRLQRAHGPAAEHHAARSARNRHNARAAWSATTLPPRPPPPGDVAHARRGPRRPYLLACLRLATSRAAWSGTTQLLAHLRLATSRPRDREAGARWAPARAGRRPSTRDARRAPSRGHQGVSTEQARLMTLPRRKGPRGGVVTREGSVGAC